MNRFVIVNSVLPDGAFWDQFRAFLKLQNDYFPRKYNGKGYGTKEFLYIYFNFIHKKPLYRCKVLILDAQNSENVAHSRRNICLFGEQSPICDMFPL